MKACRGLGFGVGFFESGRGGGAGDVVLFYFEELLECAEVAAVSLRRAAQDGREFRARDLDGGEAVGAPQNRAPAPRDPRRVAAAVGDREERGARRARQSF